MNPKDVVLPIALGGAGGGGDGDDDITKATLAPTFSSSTTYAAGDYVWHSGKMYRFTMAHEAGSWTGTDVEEAPLSAGITDLKSTVSDVEDIVYFAQQGDKDSVPSAWEARSIYYVTGGNSNADKRIRCAFAIDEYISAKINTGFQFLVFAYSSANSYLGYYDKNLNVFRNDVSPSNNAFLTEVNFQTLTGVRSTISGKEEYLPARVYMVVKAEPDSNQDLNWASQLTFITGTVQTRITDAESAIDGINDLAYGHTETESTNWEDGYVRANTGSIGTSTSYKHSEFIKVTEFDDVRYTGAIYNYAGIAGYSAANEESYVTSILDNIESGGRLNFTDYKLTIPSGVRYIVASTMTSAPASVSVKVDKINDAYNRPETEDYSSEIESIKETLSGNKDLRLTSVSLFPTIGVIGDSFSSGGVKPSDESESITNHYPISWPQIMARQTGCDVTNYSTTGSDISRFLNENYSTAADWNIVKLEADEPKSLYIIYMGINSEKPLTDFTTVVGAGTIDDIKSDYTQNEDTFAGHYGQLVDRIMAHAPNAKLIFVAPKGSTKTSLIHQIADHYGVGFISLSDHWFYSTSFYTSHLEIGHPIGIVYAGMANAFQDQISQCMVQYDNYFGNVRG